MNRKDFAKLLEKTIIPGDCTDANPYLYPLANALMQLLPNQLFRYRAVNENSLSAFDRDLIFCSRADDYNDPFDTFITADFDVIHATDPRLMLQIMFIMRDHIKGGGDFPDVFKRMFSKKDLEKLKENITEANADEPDQEQALKNLTQIIESFHTDLDELERQLRHLGSFACFSESINSTTMWAHYADYHKGFALSYDFSPILTTQGGNLTIFPVIYSDERYDTRQLLAWALGQIKGWPVKRQDLLDHIKASLYKSKDWEYEQEWRLVNSNDTITPHPSIPYNPQAIYYGLRISDINRKIPHNMAKEKGLKEYDMRIVSGSCKYELQAIPCG